MQSLVYCNVDDPTEFSKLCVFNSKNHGANAYPCILVCTHAHPLICIYTRVGDSCTAALGVSVPHTHAPHHTPAGACSGDAMCRPCAH